MTFSKREKFFKNSIKIKEFKAHHVISRETKKTLFGKFFDDIGFNIENGVINGILVPPTKQVLNASGQTGKYGNYALHLGSHPNYTRRISNKLDRVYSRLDSGNISVEDALKEVIKITDDAKDVIMKGSGKHIDKLKF